MAQLTIEIPESAFRSLKIPEEQWPAFFRSTVAVLCERCKEQLGPIEWE
ncbi:MAG: hypothetical protein R6U27_01105 [Desulfobacterales bacterium]